MRRVSVFSKRLEAAGIAGHQQALTHSQEQVVRQAFAGCESDAERLVVIDWTAEHGVGPSLYVDDARITTSSPAAAAQASNIASDSARQHGIAFYTQDSATEQYMGGLPQAPIP